MRFSIVLPLVSALALAACNSSDTVEATNESAEAVAEKVAKSDFQPPRAGRWEGALKIDKMTLGNLPPAAQEAMNKELGQAQPFTTCLTPEDAAKPDASFFQGDQDSGCTYDKFSMAGGAISADMTCNKDGRKLKSTMSGNYAADAYDISVKSTGETAPGVTADVAMSVKARRVGDCTGDEDS